MKLLQLLTAAAVAMASAGSAMAQTFFDDSITLQGTLIDLGYAGRVYNWSVLTTNGKLTASTAATTYPAKIDIKGNVGVWATSNTKARLVLSNSSIEGDIFLRKGGTKFLFGASQIIGSSFQDTGASTTYNSILSTAASNAATLSSNISLLSGTTNFTSNFSLSGGNVIGFHSSLTITATNNDPVVLKLTDFVLNKSSLTLIGSASSRFIIDISDDFALRNGSFVTFNGQLDPKNVIFNIGDTATMSCTSQFNGILLASNSAVSFSGGSTVFGEVIGKSITISGGSKIKKPKPPKPSP
jgi:hypothetical protein